MTLADGEMTWRWICGSTGDLKGNRSRRQWPFYYRMRFVAEKDGPWRIWYDMTDYLKCLQLAWHVYGDEK
jgi:hypothetical protein